MSGSEYHDSHRGTMNLPSVSGSTAIVVEVDDPCGVDTCVRNNWPAWANAGPDAAGNAAKPGCRTQPYAPEMHVRRLRYHAEEEWEVRDR
jgi:hypothetical protein